MQPLLSTVVVQDQQRELSDRCLDLTLRPSLEQVSAVRELIESYYGALLRDPDLIARMAVAVHELLENAAKYSKGGAARLKVLVASDGSDGVAAGSAREVCVSVSNTADPDRVEDLKVVIAALRNMGDPAAAYQGFMSRALASNDRSGLGLARICAEADMTLALDLNGGEVCVKAVASIMPKKEPWSSSCR